MREVIRRIFYSLWKVRLIMNSKDYSQTPCPGHCPVCHNTIFGQPIMRLSLKHWECLRSRWNCHNCNSFFCWEASDRIVSHVETAFPRGLLGNIDIAAINKGMGVNWIDPKLPDEFDPPSYKHSRNFED